jgi:hypothetical protein
VPAWSRASEIGSLQASVASCEELLQAGLIQRGVTFWNTPFYVTLLQHMVCYNIINALSIGIDVQQQIMFYPAK